MSRYIVFICLILCAGKLQAQDTLPNLPADTITLPAPVVKHVRKPVVRRDTAALADSVFSPIKTGLSIIVPAQLTRDSLLFGDETFYRFTDPVRYSITVKQWQGKEATFYSIIGLLIFFALIKNGFPRYMSDLFASYFNFSPKQRQVKEQLTQHPLPSLLMNVFFLLSIGMFLALLLQYYHLGSELNYWLLFVYCVIGLALVYGVKFLMLKFVGWIFQVADAVETYIFIVFSTNKIIGIALLPFLVIMAFSHGLINQVAFSLSIIVVLGLLAYRFFLAYVSLRRQVRISLFHFLLYLCAFEVAPLLLINKLLFRFLGETS